MLLERHGVRNVDREVFPLTAADYVLRRKDVDGKDRYPGVLYCCELPGAQNDRLSLLLEDFIIAIVTMISQVIMIHCQGQDFLRV